MISCCIIGYCYYNGFYLKKDEKEAMSFFRKSADFGYVLVQYNLGLIYYNGWSGEINKNEAFYWYKKAAEQGNVSAQNNLGDCYYYGEGTNKDLQKAFEWFKKSSEQGNAKAQYSLGFCYYNGEGTNKDLQKAFEWYKKSSEQGNASAQNNLGNCYYYGEGTNKDFQKAFEWYKKSAEQGNASAQYLLGICYCNGDGTNKNLQKAFEWYKKAAEQGDADAQYELGNCYYYGDGTDFDDDEAFKWYKKSAEQGDAEAQFQLSYLYYYGMGIDEDEKESFNWCKKSAEQGNVNAQYKLGSFYISCDNLSREDIEVCKKSAKLGNAEAKYSLGRFFEKGIGVKKSIIKSIYWYRKSLMDGCGLAGFELGLLYSFSENLIKKSSDIALFFLKKGFYANQPYYGCADLIGYIYENGEDITSSYKKAIDWYKKGAEKGDSNCQKSLGRLYFNGIGIKQNLKKAHYWYSKALNNYEECAKEYDDLSAIKNVADFYKNGYGCEINVEKSNYWYKKYFEIILPLAENNDVERQTELGDLYRDGNGVEQSYQKAEYWYDKASRQGDFAAKRELAIIYRDGLTGCVNIQKAISLMEQTKDYCDIGDIYSMGIGTNVDIQKAKIWYDKVKDNDEIGDCLRVAAFYCINNIGDLTNFNCLLQRSLKNDDFASISYYMLGCIYMLSNGKNKDIKKANEMFRQSFLLFKKKGNEVDLIYFYYFGLGTKKNYKKVLQICLKNERDVDCQFILGELYYNGFGVKKDYKEAKKWYEKAAKQGDEQAFIGLGKMFYFGKENDIDYHKAIQYFEHAKLKDSSGEAYYYLGNCYYHGLGIKANWHKAKEYYERAISFGYKCEYALEMVRIDLGEFRKVTKMEQYAKELINNKFVGEALKKQISEDLQVDFENTWECLKSNAQINLITGVVTYVTFISMGEEFWAQLDFSAIIVNFAKALEIELAEYFYKGYIIYLKKKKISPSVFPEDACFIVVNKENGEEISRKYQNENEIKNFKLGGLKYIIDDKFESIPSLEIESKTNYLSKGRSETYRKFKNFKGEYGLRTIDKHMENYANDLFSQEAFGYDSKENRKKDIVNYLIDLSNAVGEIAYQYRNPAAHGDIMGMKKASACGDYLIKVRKLIYGFLSKIKDKYKDGYK